MRKFCVAILILLSFSLIIILPNFLTVCSNNVCSVRSYMVGNQACGHKNCLNNILLKYFHIRTNILVTTLDTQLASVVILSLLFLFVKKKFLVDKNFILGKLYIKQKFLNSRTNLFNFLLKIFFSGILHPKLY